MSCYSRTSLKWDQMNAASFIQCWIIPSLFIIVDSQLSNGNSASGNAMDLARMNAQFMGQNSNCELQSCQSVCMVRNKTSGCYFCSPSCNGGTGTGMNAGPLNPPIPQMQIGGMTGCLTSLLQCPVNCRINAYGCTKCSCSASNEQLKTSIGPLHLTPNNGTNGLQEEKQTQHEELKTTTPEVTTTKITTTITPEKTVSIFTTQRTMPSNVPTSWSTLSRKIRTTTSLPNMNTSKSTIKHTLHLDDGLETKGTAAPNSTGNTSSQINKQKYEADSKDNSATIKGILVFVMTGLLLVTITMSIVFVIGWRRSVRKLKRNKSELYFIHKAYRQDSRARLQSNAFDMDEPVYARIDNTPEIPPRSPPVTLLSSTAPGELPRSPPTTPLSPAAPAELLLRTVSLSSDTSLKQTTDTPHDYLELVS